MRRLCRTLAALGLALICSAIPGALSPALAFQEVPVPPPSPSGEAAREPMPPALALGTPTGSQEPLANEGGLHVFGYEVMPKLDFGLELLYGQEQQRLELQGLNTFESDGDVSVLGKVKRRF